MAKLLTDWNKVQSKMQNIVISKYYDEEIQMIYVLSVWMLIAFLELIGWKI